ncbi:MAG: hypothetical protein WC827_02065 [Candidatus Paceibacterota bacterium]|jgi:exoribonuclease R
MKNVKNHKEESRKNKILKGTIKSVRGNIANFISDEGNIEAEISTKQLNTAMSGDKVEVVISNNPRNAKYDNKVLKVILRLKKSFVGTIRISGNDTEILPDDRKIKAIIKISGELLKI